MIKDKIDFMKETSFTLQEISSQPKLWLETFESVSDKRETIAAFINKVCGINNLQVILTGAGSSAFIGEILQFSFQRNTGMPVKAVSTTDLVTHPDSYFEKKAPVLLVSFARSGDSPESVAVFDLAENLTGEVYHLVISCSREGKLAKMAANKENACVFLLPEKANDKALAMTSSFTSMALAGLLISDINNIEKRQGIIEQLSGLGELVLTKFSKALAAAADLDFRRIVFIGSGPLKGTARESHLKVLELTDGQIACQYESFLGFRHGPKAFIDKSTLLIYIFSSDPYVHQYEADLVRSINETEDFIYSIGIGQNTNDLEKLRLNLLIPLTLNEGKMEDDLFAIVSVLPAQLLGFYKSQSLGLIPDSPSQNGGIHRIVQGVNLYPFNH